MITSASHIIGCGNKFLELLLKTNEQLQPPSTPDSHVHLLTNTSDKLDRQMIDRKAIIFIPFTTIRI